MISSNIELDVVRLYDSNIKAIYSINQISKKLKKAYPYVNKKVSGMINDRILNKVVMGKAHLCSLNLKNEKTTVLLTLNEINKKKSLDPDMRTNIMQAVNEMKKDIGLLSVIYLPSPEKKLIFVLNSIKDEEFAQETTKDIPLEKVFVTTPQLKKMILDEKTGIFTNKVLIYGYEKYFESIFDIEDKIQRVYSPFYS